jgi:hypothetical protein
VVHTPYTPFFADAYMAAHGAIGVLLVALVWSTFPKWNLSRIFFFAAIALVTVAPLLGEFLRGFGSQTLPLTALENSLLLATCFVFAAMIACKRYALAFVSLLGAAFLLKSREWVQDSWSEMCQAHMIYIGAALGLVRRRLDGDPAEPRTIVEKSFALHDVLIFFLATLVAIIVATYVLSRADGSADEWAYTWQAATFARLHAYAMAPPCESAFQSFYVFESMGRQFSQYTPGWPLFMTPFALFGVPWAAGPFSHGLMALGLARLTRCIIRLDGRSTHAREVYGGWVAALVATFGTTILLCGASRYSHVFVAALFAFALEAMFAIRTKGLSHELQTRWGLVLGSCVALMGASRPADGAALAFGMSLYFAYCLARLRIGWRATLGTVGGFALWGGLTLLILRIQLGEWFTTGYSLSKIIHPWAVAKYSWPKPAEWKSALPLATGSYAWFPCSLALGAAGVSSLRRAASGLAVIFGVSYLVFDAYYQAIDLGRNYDWGYGPRYELPFVVFMATGTGIALAPLFENARRHFALRGALTTGGPAAVVITVMVVTLVRLWPLLYPGIYVHVRQHDALNERIREMDIHHAVVMAKMGTTGFDPRDLPENLPIELYPNQDVLVAIERQPESERCIRANYPERAFYRAAGTPPVIVPSQ